MQREFNSMCQVSIKISRTYKTQYEFICSSAWAVKLKIWVWCLSGSL